MFLRETLLKNNMLKHIFSHFDEYVILLLSGTNFVNVEVFAYVAPERSPIYSSASVDGIEIPGEKIAEITSQYPSTDLLVAGDLNARTKDHFDYIPDDDIQYVFGLETSYPSDSFNKPRKSRDYI